MKPAHINHITDAELLERYNGDGNQEWLGLLLERYTLLLFGVCMKYLKDEEEAKDCVQQIFLKALTEVGKYKIDYFKSWLYMVAKNHCLMRLRNAQGREVKEITEKHAPVTGDEGKQELLDTENTYSLLEEALEELSDEQRRCVSLFYLHKNSYQQISDKTGFTLLQVKSFIQNGKRNLKLLMKKKIKQQGGYR